MRAFLAAAGAVACLIAGSAVGAQAADANPADDSEIASYQLDARVKVLSDVRTRGVSDSLMRPGVKLNLQLAHESGLVALAEFGTVSRKQFLDGNGTSVTLAGGYRFGDPSAFHAGVGLAAELFPGAKFSAPHQFDPATGMPGDFRKTLYNSQFAALELGYGALEGRVLYVLSKTYRGADTGGVCAQMLQFATDPTAALDCFARGDHGSRGTVLLDLDYKIPLFPTVLPATTLRLHAGYQRVANFREADIADFQIGLTHKRWGFDWNLDAMTTRVKARELYLVQDGDKVRRTDRSTVVFSVARKF